MASFGLEPFDDDDALDWLEALAPGTLTALHAEFMSDDPERERLRWAASGLVAAMAGARLAVPDTLAAWLRSVDDLDPVVVAAALATAEAALGSVRAFVDANPDSSDRFAPDAWQSVVETLRNPAEAAAVPAAEAPPAAISGAVCVFCGEPIAEAELLELTIHREGYTRLVHFAHERCLQTRLHPGIELLLHKLT